MSTAQQALHAHLLHHHVHSSSLTNQTPALLQHRCTKLCPTAMLLRRGHVLKITELLRKQRNMLLHKHITMQATCSRQGRAMRHPDDIPWTCARMLWHVLLHHAALCTSQPTLSHMNPFVVISQSCMLKTQGGSIIL